MTLPEHTTLSMQSGLDWLRQGCYSVLLTVMIAPQSARLDVGASPGLAIQVTVRGCQECFLALHASDVRSMSEPER